MGCGSWWSGLEVMALGVFGVKAWANVYLTPPAANAMPIQVQAGQFAFYFRYPGPDGKFGPIHPDHINEANAELLWSRPGARSCLEETTL
jgi:heme/copper-type cytochrome/quinol oxidase subunit 2